MEFISNDGITLAPVYLFIKLIKLKLYLFNQNEGHEICLNKPSIITNDRAIRAADRTGSSSAGSSSAGSSTTGSGGMHKFEECTSEGQVCQSTVQQSHSGTPSQGR